jgi:hypothetical protein
LAEFNVRRVELILTYHSGLPKAWLDNVWAYEIFLIIGELDGNIAYGSTDYYEMLETKACSIRTYRQFIKDRSAAGELLVISRKNRKRKSLNLSENLRHIFRSL